MREARSSGMEEGHRPVAKEGPKQDLGRGQMWRVMEGDGEAIPVSGLGGGWRVQGYTGGRAVSVALSLWRGGPALCGQPGMWIHCQNGRGWRPRSGCH